MRLGTMPYSSASSKRSNVSSKAFGASPMSSSSSERGGTGGGWSSLGGFVGVFLVDLVTSIDLSISVSSSLSLSLSFIFGLS